MSTVLEAVSPEKLLTMPEGEHCELVDGELREKDMGAALSAWVGGEMFGLLRDYAKRSGGWAFGDGASYRFCEDDPDRVRIPDVSYIRAGRFENDEIPDGYITIAPDLAVEVVSPTDKVYELEAKVDEYLEAGVRLVWVVSPIRHTVAVYQTDRQPLVLTGNQELTASDVLPGFQCRVADLFPKSAARSKTSKPNG